MTSDRSAFFFLILIPFFKKTKGLFISIEKIELLLFEEKLKLQSYYYLFF